MKLYHPTKGVLEPAGKRFTPLKGAVSLYVDKNGKKHELDGQEIPYEKFAEAEMELKHKDMEEKLKNEFSEIDRKEMDEEIAHEEEKEQSEKQRHMDMKMEMHKDMQASIENASERIVEAVERIPETVIPEFPDHIEEQRKWKDEIIKALQIEIPKVDLEPVIKAIESIKFPDVKIPEAKDYTKILKEIKEALPKEVDFSAVVGAIMAIPKFEIPSELISNGRIKVEVDRIAMPTGGSGSEIDTSNLATEATLQALLAAQGGGYALVKRDYSGEDLIYKGENISATALDGDETWIITKYTYSSGLLSQTKTLTGSWTNRASLAW